MFFAHQTVGLWGPAIKLSVALLLCFWLTTSNADAQDTASEQMTKLVAETQEKLEQARERYRSDLEAYVQNVESYLERREEITRRSGDINLVNKVKEERRLFAEKGTLPASLPDRIKSAPQQSRTRLETMYSNAAKSYVRAGLDREAADLEKELQAFLRSPDGVSAVAKNIAGDSSRLPEGKAIDLLSMVNMSEHVIRGNWQKNGIEITGKASRHSLDALLMTPVTVKGNYSIDFEFTRRGGNGDICLVFPIGIHSSSLVLSGWGGSVSGLGMVGGRMLDRIDSSTGAATRPGTLQNGKRHLLQLNVVHRGDQVSIYARLDGQKIVDWNGLAGNIFGWDKHALICPQAVGTCIFDNEYEIHRLELTVNRGGEGYRLGEDFKNPLMMVADVPPQEIRDKCKQWNGRYYYFSERPVNFAYAQRLVNRYQGRLLTISSAEENAFICQHQPGYLHVWLSGWRTPTNHIWKDERNRPLKYIGHWVPGDPNNGYGETLLSVKAGNQYRGLWIDGCPWGSAHVCIEWGEEYP